MIAAYSVSEPIHEFLLNNHLVLQLEQIDHQTLRFLLKNSLEELTLAVCKTSRKEIFQFITSPATQLFEEALQLQKVEKNKIAVQLNGVEQGVITVTQLVNCFQQQYPL